MLRRAIVSVTKVSKALSSTPNVRCLSTKPQQSNQMSIHYHVAAPEETHEVMDFLQKNHYPHVPTMSVLNVNYKEIVDAGLETARKHISDDMSLLVRDGSTGEVVGASILYEMKGQPIEYFRSLCNRWKGHPSYPHWKILFDLHDGLDLYQMYDNPVLLHGRTYCAKREYGALGIGTGINIASAKQVMKKYPKNKSVFIFGEGIGAYSNKIMKKMGYEFHRAINYDTYQIEGKFPFKQLAESTPHKFSTVGAWKLQ